MIALVYLLACLVDPRAEQSCPSQYDPRTPIVSSEIPHDEGASKSIIFRDQRITRYWRLLIQTRSGHQIGLDARGPEGYCGQLVDGTCMDYPEARAVIESWRALYNAGGFLQ